MANKKCGCLESCDDIITVTSYARPSTIHVLSNGFLHRTILFADETSVWNFCARFSDVIWQGNSRSVAKCRLFSQAMTPPPQWPLHYLDDWKQFHLNNEPKKLALCLSPLLMMAFCPEHPKWETKIRNLHP